uniref:Uncharacterized protein n=1 Tax=Tetranychus urticae TaxID=32264 RepID=T1JXQ8_TETUR
MYQPRNSDFPWYNIGSIIHHFHEMISNQIRSRRISQIYPIVGSQELGHSLNYFEQL